jgi:hypothetical protein
LCPVSHMKVKTIQWQTKVVQLQKLSVVLLHTLLTRSNILMLCTDFSISSLSLSNMHSVPVSETQLFTSTVGFFCNRTKNNINRLTTTAIVCFNLLVSCTITFLFIFLKIYLVTQAFFFNEYFFRPVERLTTWQYRDKYSEHVY